MLRRRLPARGSTRTCGCSMTTRSDDNRAVVMLTGTCLDYDPA